MKYNSLFYSNNYLWATFDQRTVFVFLISVSIVKLILQRNFNHGKTNFGNSGLYTDVYD